MPTDAELLAPITTPDQPAAPVPAAPLTSEQEDAALDQMIEDQGIDLPDGTDKLVPLAAVTTVRAKLKEAKSELASVKAGSADAEAIRGQVARLQEQLNAALPLAQAYQAAVESQYRQPQAQGPTPEQTADLEELARDNDYYKVDGTPDLERAGRLQARIVKEARKIAGEEVAPYAAQATKAASASLFQQALVTRGQGGHMPDPQLLLTVWNQLDPKLTSTKEGAIQAWRVAMGDSAAMGKLRSAQAAPVAREAIPPPLLTERAGGRDEAVATLSEADKRAAQRQGISEADYAKEVEKMPWRRK